MLRTTRPDGNLLVSLKSVAASGTGSWCWGLGSVQISLPRHHLATPTGLQFTEGSGQPYLSTRWIGAWELSQCCQVMPCLFTHTHTFYIFLQISGICRVLSANDFHPERAKHDSLEEVGPEDRQDLNRCQHMAMSPPLNTTEFAVQNARSCRRYDI